METRTEDMQYYAILITKYAVLLPNVTIFYQHELASVFQKLENVQEFTVKLFK